MKFQFINSLEPIATFITSLISLLTLKELIKQRQESYKPELVLESEEGYTAFLNLNKKNFVGEYDLDGSGKQKYYSLNDPWFPDYTWYSNHFAKENNIDFEKEDSQVEFKYRPTLKIINIGKDVAKEICIKLRFNLKKMIDEANNILKKNSRELITIDEKSNLIKFGNITSINFSLDSPEYISLNYITNIKEHRNEFNLFIPRTYLLLVSIINHYDFFSNEAHSNINHVAEEMIIDLSYKDIGGKAYTKNFVININFCAWMRFANNNLKEGSNIVQSPYQAFQFYFRINSLN